MKKVFLTFCLLFLTLFLFPQNTVYSASSISFTDPQVVYQMPYPGMLPDNPLFFAKRVRDGLMEFFTRDQIKKAEFYLLQSDKYMVMSTQLAKKGRNNLTIRTLGEGEVYFAKIVPLLKLSKQQGVSPSDDLLRRVKNSNLKHRGIIEDLIKELPEGNNDELAKVLEQNKTSHTVLEKFK